LFQALKYSTTFINPYLFFRLKSLLYHETGGRKMELKEPKSKFIKLRCPKCKNEQIVFGKSASTIKCLVCGKVLAEPTGGKTKVKARVLEVLE